MMIVQFTIFPFRFVFFFRRVWARYNEKGWWTTWGSEKKNNQRDGNLNQREEIEISSMSGGEKYTQKLADV